MANALQAVPDARVDRRIQPKEKTARRLAEAATVVSVVAYLWFMQQDTILYYRDATAHMEIARRVIDSPTTGYGQLGGVWLPLPHVLMLPFIWVDGLYYSGLAGSFVSMASFVVTTVLLYKIVFTLTGKKSGGIVAAIVFMTNPNVLYMQSTPMSELLQFACMAGMVYGVQRWLQTEAHAPLIGAAAAGLLGTLTRYEVWPLFIGLTGLVAFASWRKGYGYSKGEGITLAFVFIGGTGIGIWLVYNLLTFGNAFNWQNGDYAKPSLWVSSDDVAVGSWSLSFQTYWHATVANLWLPVTVLMILGLVIFVVRERLKLHTIPVLSLLGMFPFFILALERGQRPLHVTEITGTLYNVRFGLVMVLPAAILIGYLVAQLRVATFVVIAVCIAFLSNSVWTGHIVTVKDPQRTLVNGYFGSEAETAAWMRDHYSGGLILSEAFGNELLLFEAHISLKNNVYEGSYELWRPALEDPVGEDIRWIIMRKTEGKTDLVYDNLYGTARLASYKLVYENPDYYVYEVGS